MSASGFLRPEGVPEPAPGPRRRVLLLLPAAGGAALPWHWLERPGTPMPRPGPRRYPPRAWRTKP